MNARSPARASRLLVALASGGRDEFELALWRSLVNEAGAELLGLLVEDPRLLAHARSKLAREIVLSGAERPLEQTTLERQLRAQAVRIRRRFEAAATGLGWRHEFRVVRGEPLAEVARAAAGTDVLIVDAARTAAAPSTWSPADLGRLARAPFGAFFVAREGWRGGREVVALLAAEADAARAASPVLETALKLARETGSPLAAALIGPAAPLASRLGRDLARAAAAGGVGFEGVIAASDSASVAGLVSAVAGRRPRLIVLPGAAADDAALVETLLERLTSSLLWIRRVGG